MDILQKAMGEGRSALSEYESKILLKTYGVPVTTEMLAADMDSLMEAVEKIGYPLCSKRMFTENCP